MTDNNRPDDLCAVTEEDREALAKLLGGRQLHPAHCDTIRRGGWDSTPEIKIIARHRLNATTDQSAEIARLRAALMHAAICLSGFAGEGLSVDRYDDPADAFCEATQALGMPDADEGDLRHALNTKDADR